MDVAASIEYNTLNNDFKFKRRQTTIYETCRRCI